MEALPDFSLLAVALPVPGVAPQGLPGTAPSSLRSAPLEAAESEALSDFQALLPALLQAVASGRSLPAGGNRLPHAGAPPAPVTAVPATADPLFGLRSGSSALPASPALGVPPPLTEPIAPPQSASAAATMINAGRFDDVLATADQPRRVQLAAADIAPDAAAAADLENLPLPTLPRSPFADAERGRPRGSTNPPPNATRAPASPVAPAAAQQLAPAAAVSWGGILRVATADQPAAGSKVADTRLSPDSDLTASSDNRPGSFGSALIGQGPSAATGEIGIRAPALLQDLPVAPGHPRFGEEVLQRIRVMVEDGVSQARLRLNPPELGALDVRISLAEDRATVHFAASHAATRDTLEAGLPRLRELLESAGIALADGQVSERQGGPGQQAGTRSQAESMFNAEPVPTNSKLSPRPNRLTAPGRIDLYA